LNSIGTAQSPSRETTNGHGVSLSQPLRVACSCHAGSSPGLLATQQSDRRARHHHHIPHPRRVTSRASKRVDEERRSTRSSLSSSGAHISRTKRINQSTLSAAASDDISSGERPRAHLEKVCAARHLSTRCFLFLPSHPDSSLLPSCARQRTRSPKVLPQKAAKVCHVGSRTQYGSPGPRPLRRIDGAAAALKSSPAKCQPPGWHPSSGLTHLIERFGLWSARATQHQLTIIVFANGPSFLHRPPRSITVTVVEPLQ